MTTNTSVILQVAAKAAILDPAGRVLIVREATSGKNNTQVGRWGLVGGRLEPGETFVDGLRREIAEEVGLQVTVGDPLYVGEWHPVIRTVQHQIIAIFMLCTSGGTEVRLSEEHDEYAWIDPAQRTEFAIMEPDCYVIDKLLNLSS